jgi:hypothetical protein
VSYYLGDIPAQPITVEPPDEFSLEGFTSASAVLRRPDGSTVSEGITAEIGDNEVTVTLPADVSLFTVDGLYSIRVRLHGPGAAVQRIPELRFVVQDPDSEWHNLDTIRDADWPDAEHISDPALWTLLEIVRGQVIEYAPKLAADDPVPDNYRYGQEVQAKKTWNAARVDPDGSTGEGDFVLRPYPLDWAVKQILRPKRGKPVVR